MSCEPGPPEESEPVPEYCAQEDPTAPLEPACVRPVDCDSGRICVKPPGSAATDSGCCVAIYCDSDADCHTDEVCEIARGVCLPSTLCDPSAPDDGCDSESRCQVIESVPTCVPMSFDETPEAVASSCEITPATIAARDADTFTVDVMAYDIDGNLVPFATPSLVADAAADVEGRTLTLACDEVDACEGTLTATVGEAVCTANIIAWPARPEDEDVRVFVIDAQTGAPIGGAAVGFGVAADAFLSGTTDDSGRIAFTNVDEAPVAISAEAFGYRPTAVVEPTVVNDPAEGDLLIAMTPQSQSTVRVEIPPDVKNELTQGEVLLAAGGLSLTTPPYAMTILDVFGAPTTQPITAPELVDFVGPGFELVVPERYAARLGNTELKPTMTSTGTVGARIPWAIGGKIRLSDLGALIAGLSGGAAQVSGIEFAVQTLSFSDRFAHGIAPTTTLTAAGQEATMLPALAIDTFQYHLDEVVVPTLACAGQGDVQPCPDRGHVDGAIVYVGVEVPGRGWIPLGVTSIADDPDPNDAIFEVDGEAGSAWLGRAPGHDGLEGLPLTYVALTYAFGEAALGRSAGSVLVTHAAPVDAQVEFSRAFLSSPHGIVDGANLELEAPDAQFASADVVDAGGQTWTVWFPKGAGTYALDAVPGLSAPNVAALTGLRAGRARRRAIGV